MSSVFHCALVFFAIGATTGILQQNRSTFLEVVCVGKHLFEYQNSLINCTDNDGVDNCNQLGLYPRNRKKCDDCCRTSLDDVNKNQSNTPTDPATEASVNATTKWQTKILFHGWPLQEKSLPRIALILVVAVGTVVIRIIAGIVWMQMRGRKCVCYISRKEDSVIVHLTDTTGEMEDQPKDYAGIPQSDL